MPKKTTRQTKPSVPATASDPMAKAEKRIAEARRQNATWLDLSGLGLMDVPAALFELRLLQSLRLNNNQLREVPAELGELQQLQLLSLRGDQLQEMPTALGRLQQLQKLSLYDNQLQKVPAELCKLEQPSPG